MTIGIRYLPPSKRLSYHARANARWLARKRAILASLGIPATRKNARQISMKELLKMTTPQARITA